MSKFDDICKQLEQMDPATFVESFNAISDRVIAALVSITQDGEDSVRTYLHFILASVSADGVLSPEEFNLLKPFFCKIANREVNYEEGVAIFNGMGLNQGDEFKDTVDAMVDLLGLLSEDLKDDIVLLCLLVCAIDGEITQKEKDWIRQLVEPMEIEVPVVDVIEEFLNKAGTFVLATEDGDQPRMRVLGLKIRLDDTLFFAVGTFKDVYKQLQKNPRCEILASVGPDFLRWDGKAVFVKDDRLMPIVENMMPQLAQMYKEMGWELGFFTLRGGSAEIVNVSNSKKQLF